MSESILEKIILRKRERVAEAKRTSNRPALLDAAREASATRDGNRFQNAISDRSRINIIAEFKRASPSKGIIAAEADPALTARNYEVAGAAAISVLTEEDFFDGSIADLRRVRSAVGLPILRKDFVIDEYQIVEAAAAGADAVLLIAAALENGKLAGFHELSGELGLDAIVEVHDLRDLEVAASIGAKIIGVNNRNLRSFDVSLDVSRELIKHKPAGALMISESGISTATEIADLHALGYSAFLIGESLMRAIDINNTLHTLGKGVSVR